MNSIYLNGPCMCGAADCAACYPDGDAVLIKVWDKVAHKWAIVDLESTTEDWSRYDFDDLAEEEA